MNSSMYERRRLINEEDESQSNLKQRLCVGTLSIWGIVLSVIVLALIALVVVVVVKPQEVPEFHVLHKNLTSLQDQISQVNSTCSQQSNDNHKHMAQLTHLISELNATLTRLNTQVAQVNSSCTQHSNENHQHLTQLQKLVSDVNDTAAAQHADTQRKMKVISDGVAELSKNYDKFNSSTSESIDHLQKELTEDVHTINQHIGQVNTSLVYSVSSLESQFVTIKTQLAPCTLECTHGGKPNSNCTKCEECSEGWTGDRCQTPANCMTKCKADGTPCECDHGGTMDKDTCKCTCPVGWMGDFCEKVDPNVPLEKRLDYLKHLLDQSVQHRDNALQAKGGLPHLRHHLGTGVTTPQHTVTGVPVLEFGYSNNSWYAGGKQEYLVPDNIEFDPITGGRYYPESETNIYSDMFSLLEQTRAYAMSGMKSIGPQLVMQQGVKDIYNTYFGGSAFLTVSQQYLPLYKISLPPMLTTSNFKLDPRFKMALDYLPRNASEKGAFDLFAQVFEFWGTEFVETSVEGGVLAMVSSIKNSYMDYVSGSGGITDAVGSDAEAAFLHAIGQTSSQGISKRYSSSVKMQDLVCAGGNAPQQSKCAAKNLDPWKQSLDKDPYIIRYGTSPISKLIMDPELRVAWEESLDTYTKQQYQLWKGKCIDCVHGSCSPPNQYCECKGNWVGRTCSACAEGFFGNNCDQTIVSAKIGSGSAAATKTVTLAPSADHRCYMTGIKNLCLSGDCNIVEKGGSWELVAEFYGLNGATCKVNRVECYATCEQI